MPARPNSWLRLALLLAAALCLAGQLLGPDAIGIANNGDFGKVYGYLSLAPRGPETNFVYFQPEYTYSARNFWNSPYHSAETALAWAATRLAGATREGAGFDLRWLGALHASLCLAALAMFLLACRPFPLYALAPLLLFTDVCYTAYLNSFYMDAAALCGLLLMTAAAVWLVTDRTAAPLCAFIAAALLFATSKAQHSIWAWLPAAFLLWHAARHRCHRALAASGAALVLCAGVAMLLTTDGSYRGQAVFNVIFYRLGPAGADLRELGVAPEEFRFRGMHAYSEGAPAADRRWTEQFYARTGVARLLHWYLRHPLRTSCFLAGTLRDAAPEMRPENLSNFPQAAGRAPGARTTRFALWSDLRAAMLRHWPWHMPVWYLLFAAGCAWSRSPLKWLGLGIAVLGAGEFVAASLGDALDAGRHLFLFHAATDLTVCFAVAWLARGYTAKRRSTP